MNLVNARDPQIVVRDSGIEESRFEDSGSCPPRSLTEHARMDSTVT